MQPHIKIEISPTGEVIIEAIGFKGSACQTPELLAVEKALGITKAKKKKPEYYQTTQAVQKVGN